MDNQQEIIWAIRKCLAVQPVEKAWLFGSFARGEQTDDSDIDILFVPQQGKPFSLLTYAHIRRELQNAIHRNVDFVADGTLRPFVAKNVEKEKKLIYERKH